MVMLVITGWLLFLGQAIFVPAVLAYRPFLHRLVMVQKWAKARKAASLTAKCT